MTNPIQLLRDFLKWRKERLDKEYQYVLREVARHIAILATPSDMEIDKSVLRLMETALAYGIEHRKEILKQIKI